MAAALGLAGESWLRVDMGVRPLRYRLFRCPVCGKVRRARAEAAYCSAGCRVKAWRTGIVSQYAGDICQGGQLAIDFGKPLFGHTGYPHRVNEGKEWNHQETYERTAEQDIHDAQGMAVQVHVVDARYTKEEGKQYRHDLFLVGRKVPGLTKWGHRMDLLARNNDLHPFTDSRIPWTRP